MTCSIIIVNYNTLSMTEKCIRSIQQFTKDISYEIILVDNASTDGSKEFFEKVAGITYIYSKENLGFGKANNLGAKIAKGEFLFFLNSDTYLIKNSIKKLYTFFLKNEDKLRIGVLGCTLVGEDRRPNGSGNFFPDVKSIVREKFGALPILSKFLKYKLFIPPVVVSNFYEIDYVLGADMFLRSDLFWNVGGFNEQYFMYYEEAELQYKIYKKGYRNYILSDEEIVHLVAKSSDNKVSKTSNLKRITVNKSRIIYIRNKGELDAYLKYEYFFMVIIFFNFKYTWKENLAYCKSIFKTIRNNVDLQ